MKNKEFELRPAYDNNWRRSIKVSKEDFDKYLPSAHRELTTIEQKDDHCSFKFYVPKPYGSEKASILQITQTLAEEYTAPSGDTYYFLYGNLMMDYLRKYLIADNEIVDLKKRYYYFVVYKYDDKINNMRLALRDKLTYFDIQAFEFYLSFDNHRAVVTDYKLLEDED